MPLSKRATRSTPSRTRQIRTRTRSKQSAPRRRAPTSKSLWSRRMSQRSRPSTAHEQNGDRALRARARPGALEDHEPADVVGSRSTRAPAAARPRAGTGPRCARRCAPAPRARSPTNGAAQGSRPPSRGPGRRASPGRPRARPPRPRPRRSWGRRNCSLLGPGVNETEMVGAAAGGPPKSRASIGSQKEGEGQGRYRGNSSS
jgi:hypothetical protein